ncbi:MAG TPA: hypothetical protein VGG19_16565 [Tepidisphaeraceae bacterium]|jgi:hypothetical protein
MEITTRYLTVDEHRSGIAAAVHFYAGKQVECVLVAYGWGCDCPDEELYQDKLMRLSDFGAFVSAAEAADYYRVSKDNLHFKDESGVSEFLFCHEADIHFTTDSAVLQEEIQALWRKLGFERSRPAV